mgnify:FL=1
MTLLKIGGKFIQLMQEEYNMQEISTDEKIDSLIENIFTVSPQQGPGYRRDMLKELFKKIRSDKWDLETKINSLTKEKEVVENTLKIYREVLTIQATGHLK